MLTKRHLGIWAQKTDKRAFLRKDPARVKLALKSLQQCNNSSKMSFFVETLTSTEERNSNHNIPKCPRCNDIPVFNTFLHRLTCQSNDDIWNKVDDDINDLLGPMEDTRNTLQKMANQLQKKVEDMAPHLQIEKEDALNATLSIVLPAIPADAPKPSSPVKKKRKQKQILNKQKNKRAKVAENTRKITEWTQDISDSEENTKGCKTRKYRRRKRNIVRTPLLKKKIPRQLSAGLIEIQFGRFWRKQNQRTTAT
jgi:hypothetical protein